jgi:hypothetical protein
MPSSQALWGLLPLFIFSTIKKDKQTRIICKKEKRRKERREKREKGVGGK